jgi:hypothetical protein
MKKFREQNPTVGQTWLTRKGQKYIIIDVGTAGEHPVLALDSKKRMIKFTREGAFISNGISNDNDLIEVA